MEILLVFHVDGIFVVGEKERCDPTVSLGELKWYAGCFHERYREAGRLQTSQQAYIKKLAASYEVTWSRLSG